MNENSKISIPKAQKVEERRMQLLNEIRQAKKARIPALAQKFNVSEATIREDLISLEVQGYIYRVHGGAVIAEPEREEAHPFEDHERAKNEKDLIASFTVEKYIDDGDVIAIDAGLINTALLRQIIEKKRREIIILTNAANFVNEVGGYDGITLLLTGGGFRKSNFALVGEIACETLKNFHVDKAFLGTSAIIFEKGLITVNAGEASVKKLMIEASNHVYILATHNEMGRYIEMIPFAEFVQEEGTLKLLPYNSKGKAKNFVIITDNNFENDEEEQIFKDEEKKFAKFKDVLEVIDVKSNL
jgi:DeoR/GlpR family transcriptional regulator of sugar metabolism